MLKEDYNLISFGRFNENEQVVVVINNNNENKEYPVVAGYLELEMSPLEAIVLCRGCELPQKKDEEAAEKEGDASTVLNN